MTDVFVDIETYSDRDLVKQGLYSYVESPEFEVLLIAYKIFGDLPESPLLEGVTDCWREAEKAVAVCDLASGYGCADFTALYNSPEVQLWAFNAQFERVCLKQFYDGLESANPWKCIQARANYNGLPNSLENVCSALDLENKQEDGKKLISLFCAPQKPGRNNGYRPRMTPKLLPNEWEKFKSYVAQDVICEFNVWKMTDPLPEREEEIYRADQKINDRGVPVDTDLVDSAIRMTEECDNGLSAMLQGITGLDNPKSKSQIKGYVENRLGEKVGALDKVASSELAKKTDDEILSKVLELQNQLAMNSTAKYSVIKNSVCKDRRIRGILKYYGANTGRWAGKLVQLQNLPGGNVSSDERELVKRGDLEGLSILFNPKEALSELIRTCFIAPKGRLVVADFSAIEARVIAWFAGEKWREEVFATHGKIYEASASQMFGVPIEKVTKDQRKKGKIAELALGYGGGVNALKAFGADKLGLSETDLYKIALNWREKSPAISSLWQEAENGAKRALNGQVVHVRDKVVFFKRSGHLIIRLPSGRDLFYRDAYLEDGRIVFDARSSLGPKGYGKNATYGGRLVENIIQAIARDLLGEALVRFEENKIPVLFHVHDEVISYGVDLDRMIDIMCQVPLWAKGLHLKASGFTSDFYMKD